jgi:hypothetical protein
MKRKCARPALDSIFRREFRHFDLHRRQLARNGIACCAERMRALVRAGSAPLCPSQGQTQDRYPSRYTSLRLDQPEQQIANCDLYCFGIIPVVLLQQFLLNQHIDFGDVNRHGDAADSARRRFRWRRMRCAAGADERTGSFERPVSIAAHVRRSPVPISPYFVNDPLTTPRSTFVASKQRGKSACEFC